MIFIDMKKKKQTINEVVDINGSKVFVENGEVKTILNENQQSTDYIDVETAFEIINRDIDRIYKNEI